MQSPKTGVVLVDHGSKRSAANDMLFDVVAAYRRVSGAAIVEAAHMELAEPSIGTAFDKCVEQGATLVIVHPYFLSPGRHSTTDIPNLVSEAAARHPTVRYHVTQPLGLDEKIAQVILQRIEHCEKAGLTCEKCAGTMCCDQRGIGVTSGNAL